MPKVETVGDRENLRKLQFLSFFSFFFYFGVLLITFYELWCVVVHVV